jgi:hypothetical protein
MNKNLKPTKINFYTHLINTALAPLLLQPIPSATGLLVQFEVCGGEAATWGLHFMV